MKFWFGFLFLINHSLFFTQSVQDVDGNSYSTVKIGNQLWFTENLRVKHFSDGTPISELQGNKAWTEAKQPAFCFENNSSNTAKGFFYNAHVVQKGNVCPQGYHVPTLYEWGILLENVGGEDQAGKILKGNVDWKDLKKTDSISIFKAYPSGYRKFTGEYAEFRETAAWWTNDLEISDRKDEQYAYSMQVVYWNEHFYPWLNRVREGFPIRCMKTE